MPRFVPFSCAVCAFLMLALAGAAQPPTHPDDLVPSAEFQPLDREKALILFCLLKNQDFAFDFPNDGCYARCHLMTLQMRQMGIHLKRAWAFSTKERLFVKTGKGDITWDFHVAPLVPVRTDDKVQWLVFDPTLFVEPVPLEDWGQKMRKNAASPIPVLTTTLLGEPPMRNGKRLTGSGYWTSADPREGPSAHATNMLKGYINSRAKKK